MAAHASRRLSPAVITTDIPAEFQMSPREGEPVPPALKREEEGFESLV